MNVKVHVDFAFKDVCTYIVKLSVAEHWCVGIYAPFPVQLSAHLAHKVAETIALTVNAPRSALSLACHVLSPVSGTVSI